MLVVVRVVYADALTAAAITCQLSFLRIHQKHAFCTRMFIVSGQSHVNQTSIPYCLGRARATLASVPFVTRSTTAPPCSIFLQGAQLRLPPSLPWRDDPSRISTRLTGNTVYVSTTPCTSPFHPDKPLEAPPPPPDQSFPRTCDVRDGGLGHGSLVARYFYSWCCRGSTAVAFPRGFQRGRQKSCSSRSSTTPWTQPTKT